MSDSSSVFVLVRGLPDAKNEKKKLKSNRYVVTAAHCTDNLRSRQAIITMGHRSSSLRRAKNERFTQVREVEAIIEHFGKIV